MAPPTMAAIPGLKETYVQLKTRMEKAVDDFRKAPYPKDWDKKGFVPGTGWPEPGGFLPREALAILKGVAKEGIAAMEAVEVSPPYDISDITALIAVRAMVDVLATMVKHDRIGGKLGSSSG